MLTVFDINLGIRLLKDSTEVLGTCGKENLPKKRWINQTSPVISSRWVVNW